LFEHQSCSFQPEILDGFCRRQPGFQAEHTTELARAQARYFGQLLDRQIPRQISPGVLKCVLHAIGLRVHLEEGGVLRLPTGSTLVYHHCPRRFARLLGTQVALHQHEREVYACGHSGRCPDLAVADEYAIHLNVRIGVPGLKLLSVTPVGGGAATVQ
jgi:hypothetical protein